LRRLLLSSDTLGALSRLQSVMTSRALTVNEHSLSQVTKFAPRSRCDRAQKQARKVSKPTRNSPPNWNPPETVQLHAVDASRRRAEEARCLRSVVDCRAGLWPNGPFVCPPSTIRQPVAHAARVISWGRPGFVARASTRAPRAAARAIAVADATTGDARRATNIARRATDHRSRSGARPI